MTIISFFLDDSGNFSANESWFIYAGYTFIHKKEKEEARKKYEKLVKQLSEERGTTKEFKAANLSNPTKNLFYEVMQEYESFSVAVDLKRIKGTILTDKTAINRYKDYAITRIVSEKIKYYIRNNMLNSKEDVHLQLFIDEQLSAPNGYYALKDIIKEDLCAGIDNKSTALLLGKVTITVAFCDSKHTYLIQASDILANRVRHSLIKNSPQFRQRYLSTTLYLP